MPCTSTGGGGTAHGKHNVRLAWGASAIRRQLVVHLCGPESSWMGTCPSTASGGQDVGTNVAECLSRPRQTRRRTEMSWVPWKDPSAVVICPFSSRHYLVIFPAVVHHPGVAHFCFLLRAFPETVHLTVKLLMQTQNHTLLEKDVKLPESYECASFQVGCHGSRCPCIDQLRVRRASSGTALPSVPGVA